jgi:Putative Ig domain
MPRARVNMRILRERADQYPSGCSMDQARRFQRLETEMERSETRVLGGVRSALLVALLVLASLFVAPPGANAAVSIQRASLSSGSLLVEGRGARPGATVTVTSPESTASARAESDGRYRVRASNYRASTCKVTVSDGPTSAVATLSGCTPTTAPPPPTSTARLTPDVAQIGPGYVGSDFTTFSSTTSTITFGPDTLGPVRFEITAGALPAGLRLVDPNAGFTPAKSIHATVSGTPTTVQTSTFTIRATDANGLTAARTYTIVINPARTLDIVPQQWAPLKVGEFSNLWIDGTGGARPYTWIRSAGQFPPGMSLVQDNRSGPLVRITGTPTTPGTYTFTLRLTDSLGASVSRTFSVVVPAPN